MSQQMEQSYFQTLKSKTSAQIVSKCKIKTFQYRPVENKFQKLKCFCSYQIRIKIHNAVKKSGI